MYDDMTLKCSKLLAAGLNRNVCEIESGTYDAFEVRIWEIGFENVSYILLTYRASIISVHQRTICPYSSYLFVCGVYVVLSPTPHLAIKEPNVSPLGLHPA